MRALVVEDDPASSRALVRILKGNGFQAESVSSLKRATVSIEKVLPDLVILDLLLPDGNGIDLLDQIRLRDLPITVAVVSGAGNDLLAEAIVRHPDQLFDKPLDIQAFQSWLARMIQRWQERAVTPEAHREDDSKRPDDVSLL